MTDTPKINPARLTPAERYYYSDGWTGAFEAGYQAALRISAEDRATKARARTGDPDTSHEAARSVRNIHASHRTILDLFRKYGPMSDEALLYAVADEGLTMSPSGVRSRRSELVALRRLEATGRYTDTQAGRRTTIWDLA